MSDSIICSLLDGLSFRSEAKFQFETQNDDIRGMKDSLANLERRVSICEEHENDFVQLAHFPALVREVACVKEIGSRQTDIASNLLSLRQRLSF
jgi:hypothetical protein